MHLPHSDNGLRGVIYIIGSAVIFGCMPLGAHFVYAGGCNAITLVLLRSLLSLPVLLLLARRSGPLARLPLRIWGRLAVLGIVGMAITPVLLFSSYHYIASGTATTVHFVYPVFVLLGCVLFLHERLTRTKIVCLALCLGGIFCFYTPGAVSGGMTGLLLAFVSGIIFAFYIIYLDHCALPRMSPFFLCFGCSASAATVLLPYALLTDSLSLPTTASSWGVALIFSLSIMVGASVLFQMGVQLIGPQSAAILSTFEPITSVAVGIVVFHEPFTLRSLIGVVLILSAVALLTRSSRCAE
ncbi:MAG: DMT family transporter [Oscillospiraceae bacterium]